MSTRIGRWWHALPIERNEKGVTDEMYFIISSPQHVNTAPRRKKVPADVCRAHSEGSAFFLGFLNGSVGGISNKLGNLSHIVFKNTILNKK